jgi:putative transposase
VRIFGFIAAEKAEHSISIMCRVLGVSRSGFHAWQARKSSARALEDQRLTVRIAEIHQRFRGVYGSPRIHAELVLADGERLGRKRVERLMRAAGGLSDVLCGVGVTDAALRAGKASHVCSEDKIQSE